MCVMYTFLLTITPANPEDSPSVSSLTPEMPGTTELNSTSAFGGYS